jgi:hypothetical protein
MPVHFEWNIETLQAYISNIMREVPPFVKSYRKMSKKSASERVCTAHNIFYSVGCINLDGFFLQTCSDKDKQPHGKGGKIGVVIVKSMN